MRTAAIAIGLVGLALLVSVAPAAADPANGGVLVRAIELGPRNGVAISEGAGVDVALVPWRGTRYEDCPAGCIDVSYVNPLYLGVGAFATRSRGGSGDEPRRDLAGMRATIGAGWGPRPWLLGFVAVDLDAVRVTTDLSDGAHHAGPTLGAELRAGLLGQLGERVMYRVGVSYLGAVAPGIGDNAGGLELEVAVGWRLWTGWSRPRDGLDD